MFCSNKDIMGTVQDPNCPHPNLAFPFPVNPQASYSTSLCLCFLINKMERIISACGVVRSLKQVNIYKFYRIASGA